MNMHGDPLCELSVTQFANVEVAVSLHRTMNFCQWIVRDSAHCLYEMSEQDIALESLCHVRETFHTQKWWDKKKRTQISLLSPARLSLSINAGYFNMDWRCLS